MPAPVDKAVETVQAASTKCASTDAEAILEEETRGKPTAPLSLQLLPARHTQVVYFVRHGQGFHNVAGHVDTTAYLNEEYVDAHLTAFGWRQAKALKQHVAAQPDIDPQVVVVSPLTRTIETAIGAFGGGEWKEGEAAAPLMLRQEPVSGKVLAHPSVSSAGCPPFVAWEGCREHIGVHPCDKRRSTEHYRKAYPAIDFSLVAPGEDSLWKADHRESREEIKSRGFDFVQWLLTRPERRIAVVSHSSFLFFLMSNFGQSCSETIRDELHRWFDNCELRTLTLSDAASDGRPDPLWFAGGEKVGQS